MAVDFVMNRQGAKTPREEAFWEELSTKLDALAVIGAASCVDTVLAWRQGPKTTGTGAAWSAEWKAGDQAGALKAGWLATRRSPR